MIIKPEGQEKLTGFFENAIKNNTPGHAYIIEGDEGMGKKTLAAYFAALSVCAQGTGCGTCPQCRQTMAQTNPDIITVSRGDKASLGVDTVRDECISKLSLRTFHGGRRVIIIEDADLMTPAAQNAMLKSIEEPPPGTIFLLLCRRTSAMLPTVLSRSQIMKLAPLPLRTLKKLVPGCSEFEYLYCRGNCGKLIQISRDTEFKKFREESITAFHRFFIHGEDVLCETADFFEADKDRKSDLINILTLLLRDVAYHKMGLCEAIINTDKKLIIDSISEVTTLSSVSKMLETVLASEKSMGKYGNYNLGVQSMLLRCLNQL